MGGFLDTLGQKLAERWMTHLVLPGALYLAVATTAQTLGQTSALDHRLLISRITSWTEESVVSTLGGQIILLSAVLVAAAAVGLVAQGAGMLVRHTILAPDWRSWPRPLRGAARAMTARRRARWVLAAERYHRQLDNDAGELAHSGRRANPAARRSLHRAMHRIAAEEPDRPTWSGDRLQAVVVRMERDIHVDLTLVWPHLWLVLPEATRDEITAAEQSLIRASDLAGWALMYIPLTAWWWPAAPLSAALMQFARQRMRAATDAYAQLLEASVHLHMVDLADQLHIEHSSPPDATLGDALTDRLRSRTPRP